MSTFPVRGYTGIVTPHWGIDTGAADLFAPRGTPVDAIDAGRVTSAGFSPIGGWNVSIQQAGGLLTYYAHLNKPPLVSDGQAVSEGQMIGEVGDSGNAAGTGTHLHVGEGYGIRAGTGAGGGAGIGFNLTDFLRQLLGLGPIVQPGPLPAPPPRPAPQPTPAPTPGPTTSPTPQAAGSPYSGAIFRIDTQSIGGIPYPTGVSLEPKAVDAATNWVRRRLFPALLGVVLTILGGYLTARGDTGARLLGLELVAVGLSIVWFAYRDTTLVAWEAIRP